MDGSGDPFPHVGDIPAYGKVVYGLRAFEVAQPIRSGRAAHVSVHHELQVILEIVLYQIRYFTCNSVPSEYMRRGRGPLADRSWRGSDLISNQYKIT
jgi:hypothetical protein